jgi:hypothetical protein
LGGNVYREEWGINMRREGGGIIKVGGLLIGSWRLVDRR